MIVLCRAVDTLRGQADKAVTNLSPAPRGSKCHRAFLHRTRRGCAQAIVIVVDAVDIKRIGIVRDEVRRVIEHPDVRGPGQPILVLLNKMDVTVDDESEKLTVPLVQKLVAYETVRADHVVKVQPCSALNGTGVDEGFRWLAQQLTARLH